MGWRLLCCLVVVVVVVGDWVEWPNDAEVPPGVRVRTDMETGKRWVNSTKEDVEALWRASVDAATKRDDTAKTLTPREAMISALSKVPREDLGLTGEDDLNDATEEELRVLWETRQELLRNFAATLTTGASTLLGILAELEEFLAAPSEEAGVLVALESLEYELGDIDNAHDFHDSLHGFETLRKLLLSSTTSSKVRAGALRALGTCVKNEAALQKWALEGDISLLDLARRTLLSDDDVNVKSAASYALGAALRGNSETLAAFLKNDGGPALGEALSSALHSLRVGAFSGPTWTLVDKLLTLVADLRYQLDTTEDPSVFSPGPTDPSWCLAFGDAIRLAPRDRRAERVLNAAGLLVGQCDFSRLEGHLTDLSMAFALMSNLDPQFREELAKAATDLLQPTKGVAV